MQSSKHGKELNQFCPTSSNDDLLLLFCYKLFFYGWNPFITAQNSMRNVTVWIRTFPSRRVLTVLFCRTLSQNNPSLCVKTEHNKDGADATVYVWLLFTDICPRNLTYSVASSLTVTGSVFMQRRRLFLRHIFAIYLKNTGIKLSSREKNAQFFVCI